MAITPKEQQRQGWLLYLEGQKREYQAIADDEKRSMVDRKFAEYHIEVIKEMEAKRKNA